MERDGGVATIPEVTERDELTVQLRTASPGLSFPISGQAVKQKSRAKDYLSIHEQNEVGEYDEVYYLAKAE